MSATKGMPAAGSRWQHYQGGFHTVIVIAKRRGSADPLVVHQAAKGKEVHATPLSEWRDMVGRGTPRFALVTSPAEPLVS